MPNKESMEMEQYDIVKELLVVTEKLNCLSEIIDTNNDGERRLSAIGKRGLSKLLFDLAEEIASIIPAGPIYTFKRN